jgi:hypothetical protein
VGKIQWEQAMYPIINGTGKATILVKDSDMNKIPNFIDSLVVSIFSDSYPQGIAVTL